MTEVSSNSPIYTALHNAVQNDTGGYRENLDASLAAVLSEELDITEEEAQSFVDLAHISAGGEDASIEDVLSELLDLLDIDEDDEDADFNDVELEDLDFSEYIEDAFKDIAGDSEVFTEDHAGEIALMLGIGEDEAKELIEFTGGEFGQITKFLYDDDRDGEISFDELYIDGAELAEDIAASRAMIEDFDAFESSNGYNFAMDDGEIDDDNVANASIEDGKEAMAEFLVQSLGFTDSEAEDLLETLVDEELINFDAENDVIGTQAFIQFKSMVAEYSMKTDDLEDGDDKVEAFIEAATSARTTFEESHDTSWNSPEATDEMVDQIDAYYNGQMEMFSNMAQNVQSAAEMASSLAEGIGDINVGDGGGGGGSPPAM